MQYSGCIAAAVLCPRVQADVLSEKLLICSYHSQGQWDIATTAEVAYDNVEKVLCM